MIRACCKISWRSNEHLDLFSADQHWLSNYFAFNVRYAPFDDVTFRQAVAHTIPQQFIIDNIYNGFAAPADSFVSAALEYWRQCEDLPTYDLQHRRSARGLLESAGYSWDDDGRLQYPGELSLPPSPDPYPPKSVGRDVRRIQRQ